MVTLLGIRHHGPGSARSVVGALQALDPDCVLVEGPPDAQALLPLALDAGMAPPVALLIYRPDVPKHASYYPFAEFSPEWQAIRHGLTRNVPVQFIDLPLSVRYAWEEAMAGGEADDGADKVTLSPDAVALRRDPIRYAAEAAGYDDSERWWEHCIEHQRAAGDHFTAVQELIGALRDEVDREMVSHGRDDTELQLEAMREAHMRLAIRTAEKEGFQRIAVVCGAWHVPALARPRTQKDDQALLAGIKKVKTAATWIPWTYSRLTSASGYGAGIESPGYYEHLWRHADSGQFSTRWMVAVAKSLRTRDLDAPPASLIEAVRLAESLAGLRGRALPGLQEMNEAAQAILCHGDPAALRLIGAELIVGAKLGEIPEGAPRVPLQEDLARTLKSLRLKTEADAKDLDLDLRKETDLDRSRLFHRLRLLKVPWAEPTQAATRSKGTFHEWWRLTWQPEFEVRLIEASVHGNTVREAAAGFTRHELGASPELPALTRLVERVLVADLPEIMPEVMARLENAAAITGDLSALMQALPPLANVLRYGNVRQTDTGAVGHVVHGMVTRVCLGLGAACASLNDDAAEEMLGLIGSTDSAISLLQEDSLSTEWAEALDRLAALPNTHGSLTGRAVRLLHERGTWRLDDVGEAMEVSLSRGNDPAAAGAWLEGFLHGGGLLLVHTPALWGLVDDWLSGLTADHFQAVLPLLRRTFGSFAPPERRQLGEMARRPATAGGGSAGRAPTAQADADIDPARAAAALPPLLQLFGLTVPTACTDVAT